MTINKQIIFFFIVYTALSCNEATENLKKSEVKENSEIHLNDSIVYLPLKKLPKSTLNEEVEINWSGKKYRISDVPLVEKKAQIKGLTTLYEHNYAFDTIINKCKMRLVLHRVSTNENIDQLLLEDVNFLISFLVRKSKLINEQWPSETVQDMGRMTFYDDLENKPLELLNYRKIYSYFAGGGSSLKDNILLEIRHDSFLQLMNLPLSSEKAHTILEEYKTNLRK